MRCRTRVSIFSSAVCQTTFSSKQEAKCTGRNSVGVRKYGFWKEWCSQLFHLYMNLVLPSSELRKKSEEPPNILSGLSSSCPLLLLFYLSNTQVSSPPSLALMPYVADPCYRLKQFNHHVDLSVFNIVMYLNSSSQWQILLNVLNFNCISHTEDSEIIHNLIMMHVIVHTALSTHPCWCAWFSKLVKPMLKYHRFYGKRAMYKFGIEYFLLKLYMFLDKDGCILCSLDLYSSE